MTTFEQMSVNVTEYYNQLLDEAMIAAGYPNWKEEWAKAFLADCDRQLAAYDDMMALGRS